MENAPLMLAEYKAQMCTIPAGSFKRGDFTVTLSAFEMGRTPVTVGMWQEFCQATGKTMPELPRFPVWKQGWDSVLDHPIVRVSWEDCKAYADWSGLLLPTEAQWEFAACGGLKDKLYPWGDDDPKDQLWWHQTNNLTGTAPAQRTNNVFINGYGLLDMSGNVWDWCSDWFGDYAKGNVKDPKGPSKGEDRIIRGGSWGYDSSFNFRCANRFGSRPDVGNSVVGFRLCSAH